MSPRRNRGLLLGAVPLVCAVALAVDPRGAVAVSGEHAAVLGKSVSCVSAGNCSAVGYYKDSSHHLQGLLLSETGDTWARGVKATLPADAASNPNVHLKSVSCASTGNCSAVGYYTDSSGDSQGLLVNETGGTWARGVKATLPAGAASNPRVTLNSVSCAAAGECSAVGSYFDHSGQQGLLLPETGGRWARGVKATLPAGAALNPRVTLNSVSCTSAGNCSAVGSYTDSSRHEQGLLLSETARRWAAGVKATPPAGASSNPFVLLSSVSCTSGGNCSAVGSYEGGGSGLLLSETGGRWARGVQAMLPAGAESNGNVQLESVSCASAGNCSAVGVYIDASTNYQGVLLDEAGGSWEAGVRASLPADAPGPHPYDTVDSVSCASAGNCSAVGLYLDSSGAQQGLLLSETAGRWARGVQATLPAGAKSYPSVFLNSVSCASAGQCSAVGIYGKHGLLLTETSGRWARGVKATPPARVR